MNFDVSDGISRSERMTPYLYPSYFKIEEREIGDFLKFGIELSSLFNYYNFNNEIDGNWEEFFDSDMDVLVSLIARLDLDGNIKQFEQLTNNLLDAEDETEIAIALNNIFSFITEKAKLLLKFKAKLELPNNRNAGTASLASIFTYGHNDIDTFIEYYFQAVATFPSIDFIDFSSFSNQLQPDDFNVDKNIWQNGGSIKERMASALPFLQDLFANLRLKFSRLINASKHYIQNLRREGNIFEPHLGLYIAFLQLYHYVQEDINQVNARHLNFYYKDVLGIQNKTAVPDKVHLVFEPAANISNFLLPEGENLIAEMPITKQKIFYRLASDIIIGKAKIKELKNLFISKQLQIPAKRYGLYDIEELKIYKGDYAAVQPTDFLKQKTVQNPWPLLGEEQSDLPFNQRTMADGVIGLVVAAPVLYLVDGKRNVRVRFYLSSTSFSWYSAYINNFAGVASANEPMVAYELLAKAFNIHITTAAGWMLVEKFNVRSAVNNSNDAFIELNFSLGAKHPPIDIFSPEIHGIGCKLSAPAIKLEINNSSFHNAFSFLRNLEIERISVRVEVIGAQSLKLQNNFGPLSPLVPFQPFGPTPSIDSYFEVKNTNIFNRFTKYFQVHMEWFDLPKEPGGFETYFDGYDNGVTNDSFKVSVSAVQNSVDQNNERMRITANLFGIRRDSYGRLALKNDTEIAVNDFSRINFSNDLLMRKENDISVLDLFKEGGVHIELVGPPDAFGHKTYPRLLPTIMTNNAKFFGGKVAIPNPPYMPVVKSMHVDYVLEQNEIITKRKSENSSNEISLVHLYPFGYKAIYPTNNAEPIFFLPLSENGSCLLIGLEDAVPEQEISFLFQLQEMNFHHTAHDVEDIKWSYLSQNRWIDFRPSDVLSDSTNNFINSGIIKLLLPYDFGTGNTILNPDLYWLKVSVTSNKIAGSRLVGLFTQAAAAVRIMDNMEENLPDNISAGTIKDFTRKIPEIINIRQFFSAFGGSKEEPTDEYYLRISERLRHKQRPLTSLDISQMILEKFPEIIMVKCFGPASSTKFILPFVNTQIVVIPKEKENGQFLTEEPKVSLSTLLRIKQYINKITSCFANIEVGNPVYEKIKIVCSINIKKDRINTNNGYYIKMLNEDVKRFVSPWLFDNNQEIKIGGKVFVIDVLNFIRERPYINYITGFSTLHFYQKFNIIAGKFESVMMDSSVEKVNYLEASRPDAVLIAAKDHFITVLEDFTYSEPITSGIGDLLIGSELGLTQTALLNDGSAKNVVQDEEMEEYFDFKL